VVVAFLPANEGTLFFVFDTIFPGILGPLFEPIK
jgi:hypothetical protein